MKKFSVIFLVVVIAAIHVNSKEIPQNDQVIQDEAKFEDSDNDIKSVPNDEILFDDDAPQNTLVQYDAFMQSLRKKSELTLDEYGKTINVTRDFVLSGMSSSVGPFHDWVKVNSRKYPELHAVPKLQEFSELITTFSDTSLESIRAFSNSYLDNIQDISKESYDTMKQKGYDLLRDIMSTPASNPSSRVCKSRNIRKFTSLGNNAFRQIDNCVNNEIRSQKRIQSTSDIGIKNVKGYLRGVVDKLNTCYIKDLYDRPLDCVDREVNGIALNEFANFFIGLTTEYDSSKLESCTMKAKNSYQGKLNEIRNQVLTCIGI